MTKGTVAPKKMLEKMDRDNICALLELLCLKNGFGFKSVQYTMKVEITAGKSTCIINWLGKTHAIIRIDPITYGRFIYPNHKDQYPYITESYQYGLVSIQDFEASVVEFVKMWEKSRDRFEKDAKIKNNESYKEYAREKKLNDAVEEKGCRNIKVMYANSDNDVALSLNHLTVDEAREIINRYGRAN